VLVAGSAFVSPAAIGGISFISSGSTIGAHCRVSCPFLVDSGPLRALFATHSSFAARFIAFTPMCVSVAAALPTMRPVALAPNVATSTPSHRSSSASLEALFLPGFRLPCPACFCFRLIAGRKVSLNSFLLLVCSCCGVFPSGRAQRA